MELKVEKVKDKELEKIAEIGKDASEEKIEASLNYDNLTKDEKKAIDKFNEEIDVYDQTQILQFGNAAQRRSSASAPRRKSAWTRITSSSTWRRRISGRTVSSPRS